MYDRKYIVRNGIAFRCRYHLNELIAEYIIYNLYEHHRLLNDYIHNVKTVTI